MQRIKKQDQVYVLSGSHKGKTGEVEKVYQDKVWIKRLNMVTRNQRNPQEPGKGHRINKSMPLHISKIALVNPNTGKPDKIKKIFDATKKIRVFKSDNSKVD